MFCELYALKSKVTGELFTLKQGDYQNREDYMGEPCVITRVLKYGRGTELTMADFEDGGREP